MQLASAAVWDCVKGPESATLYAMDYSNLKGTPVVVGPAEDDDSEVTTRECTPKQEVFARMWAETNNKAAAYRRAYNVHPRTTTNSICVSASRIAALPWVIKRYKELYQESVLDSIMSVRELYQIQADIVTADPDELVSVRAKCCRNCYGENFNYQWRDDAEYMQACVKSIDQDTPAPDDSGGYGYFATLEPNPLCTHCYGVGFREVHLADTSRLVGKARRLYGGAEMDRFGAIKVKILDQHKAAQLMAQMRGALPELDKVPLSKNDNASPENITTEQAEKAYLKLL